jgi:5-methylcytosine-specific restriction endonuclease McrA
MFEKLDPAAYKVHKKNYRLQRDHLIAEWERETGQRWPQHPPNLLTKEGLPSKFAATAQQAHHIIPQEIGGPQAWWNLHPLSVTEHQGGVHGKGAPLTKAVKGFSKK